MAARIRGRPRMRMRSRPQSGDCVDPTCGFGDSPALALGAGEVALAGFDEDGLFAAEVAYGDGAAGDFGECAVAAVGGQPDGAAHGRGGAVAAGAEAALGVGLELAERAARELGRGGALAALLGGAAAEARALQPELGEALVALLARLQHLEQAGAELAVLRLRPAAARAREPHDSALRVEERSDRDLAVLGQRFEVQTLLGRPGARRAGAAAGDRDEDRARDQVHVHGATEHRGGKAGWGRSGRARLERTDVAGSALGPRGSALVSRWAWRPRAPAVGGVAGRGAHGER